MTTVAPNAKAKHMKVNMETMMSLVIIVIIAEQRWMERNKEMLSDKAKESLIFFELFFEEWKLNKAKEFQGTQKLCKHSAFDGMFGFSGWAGCNLHWDDGIHYGCKGCPENCPDFELADENILRERCSEDLRKQKEREERLR